MISHRDFIITTTPHVEGYRVKQTLGVVSGLTARTRGLGGKFVAGLESMVGGEVTAFTKEIEKARTEAIDRLIENARKMGANAVISLDIETSEVFEGTILISATGTAVVLEKEVIPPPP
ncbi:MAG: YbjQ family protein [Candidatus Bathyarchaeia archaeon]